MALRDGPGNTQGASPQRGNRAVHLSLGQYADGREAATVDCDCLQSGRKPVVGSHWQYGRSGVCGIHVSHSLRTSVVTAFWAGLSSLPLLTGAGRRSLEITG